MKTKQSPRLILASSSPRRQQLLSQFGLAFEVDAADIDETRLKNESPFAMTRRLAEEKALAVFRRRNHTECRVLGGDTTVAIGGTVFGKPADRGQAIEMLQALSGKTHCVYSAVALVGHNQCRSLVSETRVTFRDLPDDEIFEYCDSNDPYDKAGGYGVQGIAGQFVVDLQGSYSGVIGLPLWHTHQLIMGLTQS